MKPFGLGLIVGKFSPLHRGHEFLINTALAECEDLVVLAYNKPEFDGCEAEKKRRWFAALFPRVRAIVLDDANVRDHVGAGSRFQTVPAETESAETQRQFVAEVYCHSIGEPLDAVFTSESYGPGFVAALNDYFRSKTALPPKVVHREVDCARKTVPISATVVRGKIHGMREFVSPEVYRDFVHRICFLGAESTGKTTLAELAARQCNTAWASEYGRDLWVEKGGKLELDDMVLIARRHTAEEDRALLRANSFLFVDTSPLTTLFYSGALFGEAPDELARWAERKYDYTFLCMPDIPFVQDSTRVDEEFRMKQHEWYLRELPARNIAYTELRGTVEDRLATMFAKLDEFFPGSRA